MTKKFSWLKEVCVAAVALGFVQWSGSIKLFFDDMDEPVTEATDQHFNYGYIGFGSFDDTGMIDDVNVWGQSKKPREGIFR